MRLFFAQHVNASTQILLSHTYTSNIHLRNAMKKTHHLFPTRTRAIRLSYRSVDFETIPAVKQPGLQIHQNIGVYLKRRFEMWNTYKCHRNDHRDGLNANEKV